MNYEHFDVEIRDGSATVRQIGPGASTLAELADEFLDLMLRLQEDGAVRAILVTDGDNAFELPDPLHGLAEERGSGEADRLLTADLEVIRRIVTVIQETGKPVVAATRGAVRNAGFGFYMAADVRLASTTATFAATDLAAGLLPDWGLTFSLTRLIGPGRTLDMLWSRREISGADAGRLGLVDRVIDDDVWEIELGAYLERLAGLPQPAVRLSKLATQQAGQFDLTSMLSYEFEAQQQCWESRETAEGLAAWQEGRTPAFKPRTTDEDDED
ncbi:MAG: enoyl-CoA hydratase/isomerase family protein [Candidatus Krumholzibacteriia bacterium]